MVLAYQKEKDEALFGEVELCHNKLKEICETLFEGRFKYFFQDKDEKRASSGS